MSYRPSQLWLNLGVEEFFQVVQLGFQYRKIHVIFSNCRENILSMSFMDFGFKTWMGNGFFYRDGMNCPQRTYLNIFISFVRELEMENFPDPMGRRNNHTERGKG